METQPRNVASSCDAHHTTLPFGNRMVATTTRLRAHVETLAVDIGERNVFQPKALHAASDYIEQ